MDNNAAAKLTPRERILAFADAYGLTMESDFIPYSRSKNAVPSANHAGHDGKPKAWPSLNWTVRLYRGEGERRRLVLETSYSAGSGHAPASKGSPAALGLGLARRSERLARNALIQWELENGRQGRYTFSGISPVNSKPLAPDFANVLYGLTSDASVLDSGGFENWASEYGYDIDSRSAEATYRACLDIALKLRGALGDVGFSALRDATQDY